MAIQFGTVDGLVNISDKAINCFTQAIQQFATLGGAKYAKSKNISFGAAFQRFVEPVYSQARSDFELSSIDTPVYTLNGNEQSPARVTYCKKMGLLEIDESNDIFQITPLGNALLNKDITLKEYSFILLTKMGVFKDGIYVDNVFNAVATYFKTRSIISQIFLEKYIKEIYRDTDLVKTRLDIIINTISMSGLITKVNKDSDIYSLSNTGYAMIFNDYSKRSTLVRPAIIDNDPGYSKYIGSLNYGIFDLLTQENASIYTTYYPYLQNYIKSGSSNGTSSSAGPITTLQKIYYGTPGSGKSHAVKDFIEKIYPNESQRDSYVFRTIFHPDSDYASFVGSYKPKNNKQSTIKGNGISESQLISIFQDSNSAKYYRKNKARYLYESLLHAQDIRDLKLDAQSVANKLQANGFTGCAYTSEATHMYDIYDWLIKDGYIVKNEICYEFIPQAFTNAYVAAWQEPETQIYLIIEEINRGNCAQIFGDLFQLLDRKNGVSEYPINADADLRQYLEYVLGAGNEGIANGKLKLPANLNIIATMNTSDQSLFPMDSAFKRRWTWECVPIDYNHQESSKFIIKIGNKEYRWNDFLKEVNKRIFDTTDSEDKQMGNFFINADVDERQFIDKVMFYLWNDICKEEYHTSKNFFRRKTNDSADGNYEFSFNSLFEPGNSTEYLMQFMEYLGVNPVNGSVNAGQSVPTSSADNE